MFRWAFLISLISAVGFVFATTHSPSAALPQPIEFSHKAHVDYFLSGDHRQSMVSLHEKFLGRYTEEVQRGACIDCHGEFDEAAEDTPRIRYCGECHELFANTDWTGRKNQKPCMGCHNAAADSPHASTPNISTCAACHLPPLGREREEMKLVEFIEQERLIPWARVYDYLPGDTVFSHERHAELGRVRCQECHGPVEQAEHPLFLDVKLSMEDCMACHEASGAENDCLACHR